ncbi:PREDICTED: uncharacterized protein LOC18598559 isoform X2 [Theobroma cacao]|uniref:Uncharacterized protein LOC18598559 isoform X2 n=1 Tax=Theobroma cacao TaxID=3641 RepID=A0AB32V497_THECC|nr:PREDICTED: uncharacterized protein LOC18598559 isoform X2 [Theobroma cacao]
MLWVSLGVKFTPIASPLTREGHRRGLFLPLSPSAARSSSTCRPCRCTKSEEETFQVLTAVKTRYNDILVVDTPKSRMLLLDSTHNVHSILQKGDEKWTGSYWLIDKAREYFELSNLERCNEVGGRLQVHIDDAFSPIQIPPKGYAGIIIDLFSDGKVLSQLQEVEIWLKLSDRLMPDGRLMVNCGGVSESSTDGKIHHQSVDDTWIQNSTIKALATAFPGQVHWKRTPESQGQNYLALTGPLPDLTSWSATVPGCLSEAVKQWRTCKPFP